MFYGIVPEFISYNFCCDIFVNFGRKQNQKLLIIKSQKSLLMEELLKKLSVSFQLEK